VSLTPALSGRETSTISPCAKPGAPIRGWPGKRLEFNVEFHTGRKHLPIVTLRRAA
jgi:hypothetical protein